ncbi:ABC transporter substrate-binding protein [Desulfoluna butyratoxydans]|uniref:Periplasmic binding protein n=1 Tax=Desulfoluna butyratoxydans TaxID=231438 RepID=A0A4U8YSZ6_9BACT|nr:ABC transporter substrate-binding protein [Desulfoluna butyratoxydans]VFQ44423.1 periplasmic binding protein [Desulfoluna butyratoxydans]
MLNVNYLLSLLCSALVVTLASGGLSGCSSPSPPPEIRIGVIAPLTGDSDARWGKSYVNGAMLAVARINEQGGLMIDGRKLKVTLTFADSQGNPQLALNVARKLIARYNVDALVGAPRSQVAIPVAALAEIRRIPFVTSMATHPAVTRGRQFSFRTIFSDTFQAEVLARFAFHDLGARQAAVLYEVTSDDNSSLAGLFKSEFEAKGGQVVAFEPYVSGESDWTRQFQAIRASGAQILFLPNFGNEVPRQARLARQAGIGIPLLGGDDWWGIETGKDRAALEGGFFSTDYALDLDSPQNKAFVAAYRERYKEDPNDNAAHIYDALGLIFNVIAEQGRVDSESLRHGLAGVRDYSGVTGTMRFKGSGDPVKSAQIIQVTEGGFSVVKTMEPSQHQ